MDSPVRGDQLAWSPPSFRTDRPSSQQFPSTDNICKHSRFNDLFETTEMADQPLLATTTGEHFQPVRLHYRVLNRTGLLRAFEKLRCLDYDPTRKRRVWLYAHEARRLRLPRSYAQLPKELHPIVIGAFFLRSEE